MPSASWPPVNAPRWCSATSRTSLRPRRPGSWAAPSAPSRAPRRARWNVFDRSSSPAEREPSVTAPRAPPMEREPLHMNQQLDSDVKEAFVAQATRIPDGAGDRLRGIDYRPRTSRLSPRLTVGTLAGGGAVAGAIISVVLVGGAQPAFAGWSPSPTPGSAGQTPAADATCQAQLAAAPALPVSTGGSGWNPVTTDVRGPFTVVIYQDGGTDATCFTGPSLPLVVRNAARGAFMSVVR